MGEKYDCEWDYHGEPYRRIRPRLSVTDAIKSGWPIPNLDDMRFRWGSGGADLYSSALQRPVESLQRTRNGVESIIRGAGDDRGALLGSGDQLLGRLELGYNEFVETSSSNRLLGTALLGEPDVDKPDFFRRTFAATRDTTDAANEHISALSRLFHGAIGIAQDSAENAFATKVDAAMNQLVETASASAGEVYRGAFRRGLVEDPESGTAGAA